MLHEANYHEFLKRAKNKNGILNHCCAFIKMQTVYTSLHAVICPLINANVIGKHVTVIPLGHYQ